MGKLYLSDKWIRNRAIAWVNGKEGVKLAAEDDSTPGYVRARGVDEALAELAEIMKTQPTGYNNNTLEIKAIRAIKSWVAKLADFFGFKDAAQEWRSYAAQDDARNLVSSIFSRVQSGTEPETRSTEWEHSDPAYKASGIGEALENAANNSEGLKQKALYLVADRFNDSGKLSWWHKTVGTQYNLAKKSPLFASVYDRVQNFIGDVSKYTAEAADLAPTILPKLDALSDMWKQLPMSTEDVKAIRAPIFEGTLLWGRDEHGQPIKMTDLEERASKLSTDQKVQVLLQNDIIDDKKNAMWKALKIAEYETVVENAYEREILKPGIVWTAEELRSQFNLNEKQVGIYSEFRAAIDKSLTNLAISDMVKVGGKDVKFMLNDLLATGDVIAAGDALRDHFLALNDDKSANLMIDKADKAKGLMDRGYAPLSRFGKYTVYVENNGEQEYFGLFEDKAEAAKMARQMRENFPDGEVTHGTMSEESHKLFAGVSPETIELFGDMLGLADSDNAASKEAYETYLKLAKNNRSSMKRLIERKGISGFSEDAGRVLAGFVYSNGRMTSANAHLGELDDAVNAIPKTQGELKDAAVELREHVKNPESSSNKLGGLMFAQYLGGSVASAMVNLTQPIMMTLPYLSQYGGATKAGSELLSAARDANKETTGDAGLDAALKVAEEEGVVSPQEVHHIQAQAAGKGVLQTGDGTKIGDAKAAANNLLARISHGWGTFFSLAEHMNRRVTFIAAYRTAIAQGIANPAAFAAEAIAATQGIYNAGNRPRWARSTLGGLALTFKQYSIAYVELLGRLWTAGEAGSPERAAGRRGALIMLATLFLMSGADGIPFEQDLEDLIDGVLQRMGYNFSSKRKKEEFLIDILGQGGADFALKGVSGISGVPIDVAGRFGMGNLIPATGLLKNKSSHVSDAAELLGAPGDFIQRSYGAASKLAGGDVGGALTDISPRAVANAVKGVDMINTGEYKDGRGYKVNDVTPLEGALKAFGFQPNSTAHVQDIKGQAIDLISQTRAESTKIQEHWAQGIAKGDADMINDARQMRDDWNEKNPETPIRVSMPGILKRVQNMRKDALDRVQKTAPQALKSAVKNELNQGAH